MDKGAQDPTENRGLAEESPHKRGFHCFHIVLAFVVAAIVLLFDTGEFLKAVNVNAVANPSMFSIPGEIFSRFDSCDYPYLFVCDMKPVDSECYRTNPRDPEERGVCVAVVNSFQPDVALSFANRVASIPYLNMALYSVVMLPRLPDALLQMLQDRWAEGHLEFSLGVVFVAAYFTLLIVVLRGESSMKFLYFLAAVVYGPYLILGIFWLLQHALLGAAARVSTAASLLVTTFTLPACLLISLGHSAESFARASEIAVKAAKLTRRI
jgi:hypothetical protein